MAGLPPWRLTHWLAYASWPIALLHGLGTGSDVKTTWMIAISGGCLVAVLCAVWMRVSPAGPTRSRPRCAALAHRRRASPAGTAVWLPSGPLGPDWARRSGTPVVAPASGRPPKAWMSSVSRHPRRCHGFSPVCARAGRWDSEHHLEIHGPLPPSRVADATPGWRSCMSSSARGCGDEAAAAFPDRHEDDRRRRRSRAGDRRRERMRG